MFFVEMGRVYSVNTPYSAYSVGFLLPTRTQPSNSDQVKSLNETGQERVDLHAESSVPSYIHITQKEPYKTD